MAEKIIYNNTNISTATTSMAATYDMFVGAQQADNIVLTFEDSDSRWKNGRQSLATPSNTSATAYPLASCTYMSRNCSMVSASFERAPCLKMQK